MESNGGGGTTSTRLSSSYGWEALGKEARRLESEIDSKLVTYASFTRAESRNSFAGTPYALSLLPRFYICHVHI